MSRARTPCTVEHRAAIPQHGGKPCLKIVDIPGVGQAARLFRVIGDHVPVGRVKPDEVEPAQPLRVLRVRRVKPRAEVLAHVVDAKFPADVAAGAAALHTVQNVAGAVNRAGP